MKNQKLFLILVQILFIFVLYFPQRALTNVDHPPASADAAGALHKFVIQRRSLQKAAPQPFPLCVIARSHIGQRASWGAFALSLYAAASKAGSPIFLTLLDTDPDAQRHAMGRAALLEFLSVLRPMAPEPLLRVEVSPRSPSDPSTLDYHQRVASGASGPDFGYLLTDLALEDLLSLPQGACGYVLFTNADNQYNVDLLNSTAAARVRETDLVGMFMSSHYRWSERLKSRRDVQERAGKNVLLKTELRVRAIDLGAVLWRTAFLREHPELRFMRFPESNEFERNYFAADGQMIQHAANLPGTSSIIIEEILFLNQ